ncbi:MAG: alpha/beta hydrolase-fold protein [Anaerolineae bacterium]
MTIRNTEVRELHSQIVNEDYRIDVKLPPSYASSDLAYPIIYAVDADRGFPLVANISQFLEFPADHVAESIIVAIGYQDLRDMGDWAVWRTRDLTPTQNERVEQYWEDRIKKRFGRDVAVESGGAGSFYQFMAQELIPFIEQEYRTSGFKALTGYSYGGLFCLYVLFTRPETFDAYFAGSPSLDYDDGVLFRYESAYAQKHDDLPVRLFMTSGSREEGLADLERMARRLRGYPGLKMDVSILAGGTHVTAVPQAWTEALLFLIGK